MAPSTLTGPDPHSHAHEGVAGRSACLHAVSVSASACLHVSRTVVGIV